MEPLTMSNQKNLFFLASAAALGALALAVPTASADTFTSSINTPNSAISGFTGPYGTVTVTTSGPNVNTATVTFTSLTNSGNIYLFGDGGSVDVNVNATSSTVSGITGSNAGTNFTPGPWTAAGSGNVDGFGVLNQTIDSFDGFTSSSDKISFTLTDNSGTWASAAAVLTPNANGVDAAAHIFVTSSPANGNNGALATGFAGEGPGNIVITPEPGSLALLGTALAGLGFFSRRRRRSAA
jgi:hypothetical protein